MTSERDTLFRGFQEVSDREFYSRVMAGEKPAVVLFIKPGDPRNEEVSRLLRSYVEGYGDRISFFLIDTSVNSCHEDFGIFNFPALMYFRDSMELDRHEFVPPAQMLEQAIRRILRLDTV